MMNTEHYTRKIQNITDMYITYTQMLVYNYPVKYLNRNYEK